MQPAARASVAGIDLSAAQVESLIRDTAALKTSAGVELLDIGLNVLADLTDVFAGGTVSRSSYATLHGTATLHVAQTLDWGTAILRPYMILNDGVTFARFNLGAYLTSSPREEVGEAPATHEIAGYDILHWLNTPVGEAFSVDAGTGYLAAAETILTTQGIVAYQIDQTRADAVLPTARIWPLDANTTWLNIVNDLTSAIGYQGIWSDWNGALRIVPYVNPTDRATEWLYDTDPLTSMLGQRVAVRDFFNAPNRWVFYWSADPSGAQPVEGAGVYTFVNEATGPTSRAARNRTITAAPQQVDAVDQTALIALAQSRIDADLRLMTTFEMTTAPNPLHWHFDRVTVDDPELGILPDALVTKWDLPLDGEDMTQSWSLLP